MHWVVKKKAITGSDDCRYTCIPMGNVPKFWDDPKKEQISTILLKLRKYFRVLR